MAYNTPIATTTNFGVVEIGSNIIDTAGVISLPQSVATTANPTFATVTSTGAVTDTGNRVITTLTAGTNVTITGVAPSLTINASSTPIVATRLVAVTGPVVTTDYYVGVVAVAPVTLTLPAGVAGDEFVIKSEFGNLGNVTSLVMQSLRQLKASFLQPDSCWLSLQMQELHLSSGVQTGMWSKSTK